MGMADKNWKLCNDDGFVYQKRKKEESSSTATAINPEVVGSRHRREQRKKVLERVREQYRREIQQWEGLTADLQQLKGKSNQAEALLLLPPLPSEEVSALQKLREKEGGICRRLVVDELLSQAEAQEAILQDLLNQCDAAEASCKAQKECQKQSFIQLPIWATPRGLFVSLSEVDDQENEYKNG